LKIQDCHVTTYLFEITPIAAYNAEQETLFLSFSDFYLTHMFCKCCPGGRKWMKIYSLKILGSCEPWLLRPLSSCYAI